MSLFAAHVKELLSNEYQDINQEQLQSIAFNVPWAAKSFALMIAASEAKLFSLKQFQQALIHAIEHSEMAGHPIVTDQDYYDCWLHALSSLLVHDSNIGLASIQRHEAAVCQRILETQHDHDHVHHPNQALPIYRESGK